MIRATLRLFARCVGIIIMAPIFIYQKFISPALPARCRYYPTCSSYALQAIRRHGPIIGLALAVWRVVRCNPWSHGGVDPVPQTAIGIADARHLLRRARNTSAAQISHTTCLSGGCHDRNL